MDEERLVYETKVYVACAETYRKIAKLYQKLAEKEQEARSDYTKNNRPIKPRRNSNAMRECERYTSEAEGCEIEAGRRLKKLKELVEGRSTAMPHAPHEPVGND